MTESEREARTVVAPGLRRSPWLRWLVESARSLVFKQPRWAQFQVTPLPLLGLFVLNSALTLGVQYVSFEGRVLFYWQAIGGGWLAVLLQLWGSWVVVRSKRHALGPGSGDVPGVAALFGALTAQSVWLQLLQSVLLLAIWAVPHPAAPEARKALLWSVWGLSLAWTFMAGGWLLGRQARTRAGWLAVLAVLALNPALQVWAPRPYFWYPDPAARQAAGEQDPEPEPPVLTQELMESQSAALITALDALQPERRGLVDLYAITFAPFAEEDVFSREVGMVGKVMAQRFDAQGRVIQLQNHASTIGSVPWATPLNLHRAIARAAERMDRDDDILFIHLTSHGARDGKLSAGFWPLTVDEVTPQQLKAWLDEAGVRFRVISVSACFSGSWVQPLSTPGTLVMTAADADHTSYGCGRKSDLTFFGRAMYDEQLRQTHSFETAHAVARAVIERREKEAGKTDGYSNPQIFVGGEIRAQLAKLEARLKQTPSAQAPASAPVH